MSGNFRGASTLHKYVLITTTVYFIILLKNVDRKIILFCLLLNDILKF